MVDFYIKGIWQALNLELVLVNKIERCGFELNLCGNTV